MVTTVNRETESNVAIAAQIAETEPTSPVAPAVDISAVPETPDELLKQWDAPKRSFIHAIPTVLENIWESIVGPGTTEQQRVNRKIFEHSRFYRAQGPHF